MNKIIKNTILLFFIFGLVQVNAQDAQFTQIYATPLYTCPAFAGSTIGSRAVFNFRDQWPAIPGAFVTFAGSLDHYFSAINSGVGILFLRDWAGSGRLGTTNISLQYTYDIRLTRDVHVRPAIQFTYGQRSIDFYRLLFNDQLDFDENSGSSVEIPSVENTKYTDFGIGFLAYSEIYWGGLSIDHLTEPNQSLTGGTALLSRKYTLFGGYKYVLGGKIGESNEESVTASFLFKSQAKYDQLDIGGYWYKRPLVIGLWYRGIPIFKAYDKGYQNNDAIAFMTGIQFEKTKVALSYDFTISRLVVNTAGAIEISIIYEFNQNLKLRRKSVIIPCPKF